MTTLSFIASIVACGFLLSLLPSDAPSSRENSGDLVDYHLVPYAGDAFGA